MSDYVESIMVDGDRYSFRDKFGSPKTGTYERESGNLFSGHGESYLSHNSYYEVASCTCIKALQRVRV